jgi:hypothetical protein
MDKLTTTGKLIAIAVILGLIYGGYKLLGGKEGLTKLSSTNETEQTINPKSPEPDDANVASSENVASASNSATASNTASSEASADGLRQAFTYEAPAPVNGKLKGVVVLGASGFDSFIVRMDKSKNWKLEKSEFGNSLVTENMATDEDIRTGLKKYIGNMLDFGVGGREIHFVVSSGAQKADVTQKIVKNLKTLGYVVNPVTSDQEGKYGLKTTLPAEYQGRGFFVDIGSGNTKISWTSAGQTKALESYGAKYFQNGADDAKVYDEISTKVKQVPAANREVCFIIGGAPFTLAKEVRQGKERYTVLNAPSAYKPEKAKDKAGVNIYKAIADGTGCKQFVFDWDANFAIGALLDLPY